MKIYLLAKIHYDSIHLFLGGIDNYQVIFSIGK